MKTLLFYTRKPNLHKEITCCFSTIGDDGSRQSPSDAAILAAVLRCWILILTVLKICNGKTKGLAIRSQKQYTFEKCIVLHKEAKNNTLLNLHKETTGLFFTIGEVRNRQWAPDAASFVRVFWKSVLFLHCRKICNGKIKGLAIHV